MADVLGPEWGQLAGMPAEAALELVAQMYESDPDRQDSAGGNDDNEPQEEPTNVDREQLMKDLARRQRKPIGDEFVGRRDVAKSQARQHLVSKGKDWDRYESAVMTIMSRANPEQQANAKAWVEAWWYVWGLEQRSLEEKEVTDDNDTDEGEEEYEDDLQAAGSEWDDFLEDDEDDATIPPREEQVVRRTGPPKRTRQTPREARKPKIKDPKERQVKSNFERFLGRSISDEEWIALDDVSTHEDYKKLQGRLERKGGRR